MAGRVEGRVCMITGAASGLGLAASKALLAEGATVVMTDRPAGDFGRVANDLGPGAWYMPLDVAVQDQWTETVEKIQEKFGQLDVLVNNAGIVIAGNIEDLALSSFRKMQSVNVEGVFLGCQAAVRAMKQRPADAPRASIINLSSIAGLRGYGIYAGYCSSKGAVRLLTKSVAAHCLEKGLNIRCNSIHPNAIDTPMSRNQLSAIMQMPPEDVEFPDAMHVGQPEDIAGAVVYLASDDSRHMNGAEMVLDAGITCTSA